MDMEKMKKSKRGITGNLMMLITGSITFVVLVVVLVIGSQVTSSVKSTQTTDSAAYNMSRAGEGGFKIFGDYLTIIATVVILVVVVALMVGVIAIFGKRE